MSTTAQPKESLSVVVPVYRSVQTLPALVQGLADVLPSVADSFEVIFVNDGSSDGSWEAIEAASRRYAWVRGICLMRNYGQHNALLCGIRAARHPIVITMDDDLQHPPSEIPLLLAKLREGYDVVYGWPKNEKHELWRSLASQLTKLALAASMGAETARKVSAFRAFRTHMRDAFARYEGSYVCIDVLLTWGSSKFSMVEVRHEPRADGKSNYTLRKLLTHALNMITGFSILPLQLASIVGFAFTVFGFFVLMYVLIRYIVQGGSVPGFPFLASLIAIFSGAQMFSLGILGEYVARVHFRIMDRPAFAVRARTTTAETES